MVIKKHRYCSASAGTHTTLDKSLEYWKHLNNAVRYYNNKMPLCSIYNYEIKKALEDDVDCLILVHDDVILEENPIPKLEKLFDEYDLVGVAGASKIELKSPALWHLMGGGFNGGHLHGKVCHVVNEVGSEYGKSHPSYFGPYPHRAVMIDGVFMALNRKAMETVEFDRKNPCKYHFYDLNYSLDCHLAGLKVGVGDILITHESPGLSAITQDWLNGEKYFLEKYGH